MAPSPSSSLWWWCRSNAWGCSLHLSIKRQQARAQKRICQWWQTEREEAWVHASFTHLLELLRSPSFRLAKTSRLCRPLLGIVTHTADSFPEKPVVFLSKPVWTPQCDHVEWPEPSLSFQHACAFPQGPSNLHVWIFQTHLLPVHTQTPDSAHTESPSFSHRLAITFPSLELISVFPQCERAWNAVSIQNNDRGSK